MSDAAPGKENPTRITSLRIGLLKTSPRWVEILPKPPPQSRATSTLSWTASRSLADEAVDQTLRGPQREGRELMAPLTGSGAG
jgi:hypothetical protein